jgi:hypothetical protein
MYVPAAWHVEALALAGPAIPCSNLAAGCKAVVRENNNGISQQRKSCHGHVQSSITRIFIGTLFFLVNFSRQPLRSSQYLNKTTTNLFIYVGANDNSFPVQE